MQVENIEQEDPKKSQARSLANSCLNISRDAANFTI